MDFTPILDICIVRHNVNLNLGTIYYAPPKLIDNTV